jgi:hypothetical protein
MPSADLQARVASLSGATPRNTSRETVRSILGYDIASMRESGFDPSIIAAHEQFNVVIDNFLAHATLGGYLTSLTPHDVYFASGVRVLHLEAIREEIHELAPGALLLPYGYLPIATSIGGNAVLVALPDAHVVWADHNAFGEDGIVQPGSWNAKAYSPDSIANAVTLLDRDFLAFFSQLLDGALEARLGSLD